MCNVHDATTLRRRHRYTSGTTRRVGDDTQGDRAMLKDFRAFLMRGNVVDLAVAVVIGGAFGAIVTSFVNDILMPPIGRLLGQVNFADLFVTLSGGTYPSLAAAKAAGAATVNYGVFLNTIINFVIIAFAIFAVVRGIDRLRAKPTPPSPSTKECPQCAMAIPLRAVRCPHCTSNVGSAQRA
jgi:large conductance mechanosensitive channel